MKVLAAVMASFLFLGACSQMQADAFDRKVTEICSYVNSEGVLVVTEALVEKYPDIRYIAGNIVAFCEGMR